jgi:hypothetical protein
MVFIPENIIDRVPSVDNFSFGNPKINSLLFTVKGIRLILKGGKLAGARRVGVTQSRICITIRAQFRPCTDDLLSVVRGVFGGRSSAVEPSVVVRAVAGSNPVGHPISLLHSVHIHQLCRRNRASESSGLPKISVTRFPHGFMKRELR